MRRDHRELRIPVHPPQFLATDYGGRIKPLYFGCNLCVHSGRVERGDSADARMTSAHILPGCIDIIADRADAPDAGYHHSFGHKPSAADDFTSLIGSVEDRPIRLGLMNLRSKNGSFILGITGKTDGG
jgi:hypothetical protein